MIRGGCLRYKRYDAHFLKKSSVELPFSSFGDHLINVLRKVNRLIYTFKINKSNIKYLQFPLVCKRPHIKKKHGSAHVDQHGLQGIVSFL